MEMKWAFIPAVVSTRNPKMSTINDRGPGSTGAQALLLCGERWMKWKTLWKIWFHFWFLGLNWCTNTHKFSCKSKKATTQVTGAPTSRSHQKVRFLCLWITKPEKRDRLSCCHICICHPWVTSPRLTRNPLTFLSVHHLGSCWKFNDFPDSPTLKWWYCMINFVFDLLQGKVARWWNQMFVCSGRTETDELLSCNKYRDYKAWNITAEGAHLPD